MDGQLYTVALEEGKPPILDGKPVQATVEPQGEYLFSVIIGSVSTTVLAARRKDEFEVLCDGAYHRVSVLSERSRLLRQYAGVGGETKHRAEIHAPMPAMVVKIEVNEGDDIKEGQGLVILEAMKMENELRAPHAGKVRSILATEGKAVEKGELLLLLE